MHRGWAVTGFWAVISLMAADVSAQPGTQFGRFFTTPQQRERLELARTGRLPPDGQLSDAVSEQPLASGQIHVRGFVQRSDGRKTVWLDEQSFPLERRRDGDIHIYPRNVSDGVVDVVFDGTRLKVKPGQVIDRDSGRVAEAYTVASPPEEPAGSSADSPGGALRSASTSGVVTEAVRGLEAFTRR